MFSGHESNQILKAFFIEFLEDRTIGYVSGGPCEDFVGISCNKNELDYI